MPVPARGSSLVAEYCLVPLPNLVTSKEKKQLPHKSYPMLRKISVPVYNSGDGSMRIINAKAAQPF